MILMLAIFILFQDVPASNLATKIIIAVCIMIFAAIITAISVFFQTQANRRYTEFTDLKTKITEIDKDVLENTTYDKARNDNFKDHEDRMKESVNSLKKFLTEYKKESRADWKDFKKEVKGDFEGFKKEVKGDFEGFKTDIKKEISDLRDEIHDDK